jgi:glutaredoxin
VTHLVLYGRPGCHLCEDMRAALEPFRAGHGFSLEEVDVDAHPALAERYGMSIPVLVCRETEVCRHFLDPAALARALTDAEVNG